MHLTGFTLLYYPTKIYPVLAGIVLPLSAMVNYFLFGTSYFTEWTVFAAASGVTFFLLTPSLLLYNGVAVFMKTRLPDDRQLLKRLLICIALYLLMAAVILSLLFRGYEYFGFLNYRYNEDDFTKAFISLAIASVFLTFLGEGSARFQSYKTTVTETEQLKKEYLKSQLLGMKSQINPHFLFNGLNTLSSLIHEDGEKAEKFLDEMSKVYRYFLRSASEQLVELGTELQFIYSYYYLLKERYGDALYLEVAVAEEQRTARLPPLTLQTLFESACTTNAMSKEEPLTVTIRSAGEQWLEVENNIQLKITTDDVTDKTGLDNIATKFRLLSGRDIFVQNNGQEQIVRIPLISTNEVSAA